MQILAAPYNPAAPRLAPVFARLFSPVPTWRIERESSVLIQEHARYLAGR